MAEWLRSRLQSDVSRFDSGCRLGVFAIIYPGCFFSGGAQIPLSGGAAMHLKLHVEAKMRANQRDERSHPKPAPGAPKRRYARYSRQLILPEVGTDGQSALLN